MMRIGLVCAVALFAAAPSAADEVWTSTFGDVFWETTIDGDTAVLSYFHDSNGQPGGRIYLPGLGADVTGTRGSYVGYWVEYDGGATCPAELTDPLGRATDSWGRIELSFDGQSFPASWRAVWENCFADPTYEWVGDPASGGASDPKTRR